MLEKLLFEKYSVGTKVRMINADIMFLEEEIPNGTIGTIIAVGPLEDVGLKEKAQIAWIQWENGYSSKQNWYLAEGIEAVTGQIMSWAEFMRNQQ